MSPFFTSFSNSLSAFSSLSLYFLGSKKIRQMFKIQFPSQSRTKRKGQPDFYLCNGCPKSIKTTLNRIFSSAVLTGASKTTLPKVFPMKCFSCPGDTLGQIKIQCNVVQQASNNIVQEKTLYNVVFEAPDNNAQENVLFNVVLKLFGQQCTDQNSM